MKTLIVFLSLLFVASFSMEAQLNSFGKTLGKKVVKKKTTQPDLGKLFAGGNVETEDVYAYDFSILYEAESESTEGLTMLKQLYNSDGKHIGMDVKPAKNDAGIEEASVIIDLGRSYMILINTEEGQAMVFAFEPLEDQLSNEENEDKSNSEVTITPTHETKTIAGYLCKKSLYQGPDGSGEIWTTQELDYENFDAFSYLKRLQQQQESSNSGGIWGSELQGFVMEIEGVDAEGKNFHLTAIEVNKQENTRYTMSEYDIVDMTGIQKMQNGSNNFMDKMLKQAQEAEAQKEKEKELKKQEKQEKRKKNKG